MERKINSGYRSGKMHRRYVNGLIPIIINGKNVPWDGADSYFAFLLVPSLA